MNKDFTTRSDELRALMQEKLGFKSRDLADAFRRAGRRLPRRVRQHTAILVQAEERAFHPKLAATTDPQAVEQAFKAITGHLQGIDVADERLGRWLQFAGTLAFNFIVIAILFVIWMRWRGFV